MTTTYYNLKKSFYREHKRVEQRSWDEIDKFLNLHQIKFSGFDLPKPIFTLDEINFPDFIIEELRMQGITRPTAIQSMTWPALYSGRDLMCIGLPTHSRVVAYICPALVFIKQQEPSIRKSGPLVLIVTQTKEVAKEILTQSQMFMQQSFCSFCCLFDDENINTQALQLREHEPDILIGNYHRLCELLDSNVVNLKNVSLLIMDDFYRNRSARLSDEIKRVVNETRSDRQTAIFSRIVPSGLQKSNGDEFQNDAVFICIGNDDIHVSNKDLPQSIHICTMAEKKKKLQDIITEISEKEKNFKILVYANGFKKIRITEKIIKELGIDTFAYERTNVGRRRRAMKEKVYYNFNATPNSVLVASDVVSSKVELPDLNYIINADFPVNLSLYLNRMRMSNIKKYISIFIAEDARHADRLIYVLNECRQQVPTILYKISEAYINSGKDVDRMPSLQEINEGLTKPVEKPIPKPLPPTVEQFTPTPSSSTIATTTANIQESIIESPISPNHPTVSPIVQTNNNNNKTPIFSTLANNYQSVKRFKSVHNSFPPPYRPTSSVQSHVPAYSQTRYQPPLAYNHNIQYSIPPPPVPSTSTTQVYSYPNQVYSYPTNQSQPYYNSYYQTNQNQFYGYQQQPKQPITSYTNEVYQQQQYLIKTEPNIMEQNKYYHPSESNPINKSTASLPYFTNPIAFKQEPVENPSNLSNLQLHQQQTMNDNNKTDDDAFSIVSHLLKDKQILSQLEKLQSLRQNPSQTGSLYQGNWNFSNSSSSQSSS